MSLNLKKSNLQGATDFACWYAPVANTSDFLAFTASSAAFTGIGATMTAGKLYRFAANQPCWIKQGAATPSAAKAVGSTFVAAGNELLIDGAQGAVLAVLADSTSGSASLSQVDA